MNKFQALNYKIVAIIITDVLCVWLLPSSSFYQLLLLLLSLPVVPPKLCMRAKRYFCLQTTKAKLKKPDRTRQSTGLTRRAQQQEQKQALSSK